MEANVFEFLRDTLVQDELDLFLVLVVNDSEETECALLGAQTLPHGLL